MKALSHGLEGACLISLNQHLKHNAFFKAYSVIGHTSFLNQFIYTCLKSLTKKLEFSARLLDLINEINRTKSIYKEDKSSARAYLPYLA